MTPQLTLTAPVVQSVFLQPGGDHTGGHRIVVEDPENRRQVPLGELARGNVFRTPGRLQQTPHLQQPAMNRAGTVRISRKRVSEPDSAARPAASAGRARGALSPR